MDKWKEFKQYIEKKREYLLNSDEVENIYSDILDKIQELEEQDKKLNKDSIIINSIESIYDNLGYDEVLESPIYKLKSVTVEFLLKHNFEFKGIYNILTSKQLSEEEIKDKIIEVLQ